MPTALILTWCALAGPPDCREQVIHDLPMTACMIQAQAIASEQQRQNLWLVNRRLSGWKCRIGPREGGA
jgi:hypothetical protein